MQDRTAFRLMGLRSAMNVMGLILDAAEKGVPFSRLDVEYRMNQTYIKESLDQLSKYLKEEEAEEAKE